MHCVKNHFLISFQIVATFFFQLVIGNLLHTRKHNVKLISQDGTIKNILLNNADIENGTEIEDLIIKNIKTKHDEFFNCQN